MDPSAISQETWSEIGGLLTRLWIFVLLIVIFAGNMILGHNMIPSLVASDHLPRTFQKTRPFFYALALASFGAALFILTRVVSLSGLLRDFWADYWI